MTINIIVAATEEGGIGFKNDLPWHRNKIDMAWFRSHTLNNVVVMGRKTYDSIGRELPKRINYCITNHPFESQNILFEAGDNFLKRIEDRHPTKEIYLIGGAELIINHMDECDNLYLTIMHENWDCDTFLDMDIIKGKFDKLKYSQDIENMTFQIRGRSCNK